MMKGLLIGDIYGPENNIISRCIIIIKNRINNELSPKFKLVKTRVSSSQ